MDECGSGGGVLCCVRVVHLYCLRHTVQRCGGAFVLEVYAMGFFHYETLQCFFSSIFPLLYFFSLHALCVPIAYQPYYCSFYAIHTFFPLHSSLSLSLLNGMCVILRYLFNYTKPYFEYNKAKRNETDRHANKFNGKNCVSQMSMVTMSCHAIQFNFHSLCEIKVAFSAIFLVGGDIYQHV